MKVSILLIALPLAATTLHFDLTRIPATQLYTESAGFGYESPATAGLPQYFSIRVPEEGNYHGRRGRLLRSGSIFVSRSLAACKRRFGK